MRSPIYIVTPSYRIENLSVVRKNVDRARALVGARGSRLTWIVVLDGAKVPKGTDVSALGIDRVLWFFPESKKKAKGAGLARNSAIETIPEPDAWVALLDDDNLLSLEVVDALLELPDDVVWMTPSRVMPSGRIEPPPFVPKEGNIDTAQLLIRKRILGDAPFRFGLRTDGALAQSLVSRGVTHLRRPDLYVSYNTLRPLPAWVRLLRGIRPTALRTRLADELPKGGTIVEVGLDAPPSSYAMIERLKERRVAPTHHVVDPLDAPARRERWERTSLFYRPFLEEHRASPADAARAFADGSVDTLLLDASRGEAWLSDALRAFLPKVKRGGTIAADPRSGADRSSAERALHAALGAVEAVGSEGLLAKRP